MQACALATAKAAAAKATVRLIRAIGTLEEKNRFAFD